MNREQPNSSEQEKLVSLDTSEITSLLKKYNRQFGIGATMGGMLSGLFEAEDEETDENKTTSLENQKAEELLSFDQMTVKAEKLLEQTGLEFQPVRAGWFVTGSEGTHYRSRDEIESKRWKTVCHIS